MFGENPRELRGVKVGFFPGVWYRSWVGGEIVEMRLSILCFLVMYDWMIWLIDDGIDWGATGFIISFSRNKWEGLWCCVTSLNCLFCQEYCGMVIMGGEIVVLV